MIYQQNWHHTDDFRASKPIGEGASIQRHMILGGIPLSGKSGSEQVVFNFSGTQPATTNACILFAFPTFTKTLIWHESLIELL